MHGSPNIVLMQAYTLNKDYGSYFNYMSRKKAINGKKYLDPQSQKELQRINDALAKQGYTKNTEKDPTAKSSSLTKLTEEKTLFTEDSGDYGKYIGYMIRINALARKERLSQKEIAEKERLEKATAKLDRTAPIENKPKLNDANDTLIGVYSSEKRSMKLIDANRARERLREGRENGSVLWEPVVSFDNDFLVREGILNKKTGELHDDIIKDASYKMMSVATDEEKLNNPYWVAAIHRNTDNVHIHFALVEKENSRKMIKYKDTLEPKAKFKMKTVYDMKSAFSNTLIDISKTQDRITKHRDKLREIVMNNAKEEMQSNDFKTEINGLISMLPSNHKKWQYATLHKIDPKITDKLDGIVDHLLQGNSNYDEWSDLVKDVDEMYKGQYGKSKNEHKNYAINQFTDLRKRCGNKLLSELKQMDLRKQKLQNIISRNSDNVTGHSHKRRSKSVSTKRLNTYSSNKKDWIKTDEARKREQHLKKMIKPILSKRSINQLKNSLQKEFENGFTSFDKVKAMQEFNRWHQLDADN